MKNQNKGSVVQGVLAIIALVLLAGGAYFMRINSKEKVEDKNIVIPVENVESISTSDWKTYSSTKYGYTIKYPNDWMVKSLDSDESLWFVDEEPESDKGSLGNLRIDVCENVNTDCARGGFAEGMRVYKDIPDLLNDKVALKTIDKTLPSITLNNNIKGFGVITVGYSSNFEIMFDYNGKIYIIGFPTTYDGASLTAEQKKVISTFKFTPTPDPLQYETPISEIRRIEVTSPKGGEFYRSGQKVVISWNDYHGPDADTYTIMLLGEKSAQVISNSFVSSSGLDGLSSIEWTVPNDLNGKYRIEVYKPGSRELVGRSNEFTIQQ